MHTLISIIGGQGKADLGQSGLHLFFKIVSVFVFVSTYEHCAYENH